MVNKYFQVVDYVRPMKNVVVQKPQEKNNFPEIPEGYNPKGKMREVVHEEYLDCCFDEIVIDGFIIINCLEINGDS